MSALAWVQVTVGAALLAALATVIILVSTNTGIGHHEPPAQPIPTLAPGHMWIL